jgi:D-arabinose 1-dehydrogenase-like Zn-dependent alcohol dehydrogenase
MASKLPKLAVPKVCLAGTTSSLANSTVIITSSSDAKLEQAKKLGADHTINYRTTPVSLAFFKQNYPKTECSVE